MSGGETVRVGMALEALRRFRYADDYSERGRRSLNGEHTAVRRPAGVAAHFPACVLRRFARLIWLRACTAPSLHVYLRRASRAA
ncbi:hypothetical protein R69888_00041 [Paraburkholderia haematera]|uniref:Uncharacterized protein n=1 Tax=Paraburkholderia haematera TaxID=2793077 RepID=A0ABN7KDK9_9BURK|nr:hypothetical protein R69888_00041 [Paraburkholderia haematera]